MKTLSIPPITEPLGKYWEQPKPANFSLTLAYAWMDTADFKRLAEYSASLPSGTYSGKMWKSKGVRRTSQIVFYKGKEYVKTVPEWYLCWYGEEYTDEKGVDRIKIQKLPIRLTDGDIKTHY